MLQVLIPVLGSLLSKVVDNAIPNPVTAANVKKEMMAQLNEMDLKELEVARDVVVAEVQGESQVQRNWRPHLMYFLMGVIAFNTVLIPLLAVMGINVDLIDIYSSIPNQLWDLLMIGMGGYIAGRTVEKVAKNVTETYVNKNSIRPEGDIF